MPRLVADRPVLTMTSELAKVMAAAKERACELRDQAVDALNGLSAAADPLRALLRFVVGRAAGG